MMPARMLAALVAALCTALPASLTAQQFPSTPPAAAPLKPAHFPPFAETTLPNGMRLVLVESHAHPVVSLSLSLPAGNAYDPAGQEGLAAMEAGLLTKGTGTRSADQIAATIEGVGGSLAATTTDDFMTIRADVLSASAPLAFTLMADVVMHPTFPDQEIALLRKQTLSALQLELSQPASLASRFFAKTLYGQNPYGRNPLPASVRAITRTDLVAFQKARLRPTGALLVIAGDITLPAAKRLATRSFAGWTGAPAAAPPFPAPPTRAATQIVLVHRPGSVQSNIVVGNTTFRPTDPRWYAATVANRVLGGGFDNRLFRILREQKSWTYDAHSVLARPKGIGYFQAGTEVRTSATDSALTELMVQLRRMDSEPVSAAELKAAKSSLVGSFPLTIETAQQVAGAVAQAKLLGLPADYLQTYRTRLAAVTPAQLEQAADAIIRPNASLIVVVGDGAKLYDKLSKIAPVILVDAQGKPLTPADLVAKGGMLDLDLAAITAHRDSFAVMVQGRPLGYVLSSVAKTADGYTYTENTQIATALKQTTEVTLDDKMQPRHLKASGMVQGQATQTDVTVAAGHATGSVTAPTPQGMKTTTVDLQVPPGTLEDNSIQMVLPALHWTKGAHFSLSVLTANKNTVIPMTLQVTGQDSLTVPAGTFPVYQAELTGGPQPITFFVEAAPPHRVVKYAIVGTPIEVVLVK